MSTKKKIQPTNFFMQHLMINLATFLLGGCTTAILFARGKPWGTAVIAIQTLLVLARMVVYALCDGASRILAKSEMSDEELLSSRGWKNFQRIAEMKRFLDLNLNRFFIVGLAVILVEFLFTVPGH